jgi:hypothetical protein
MKSFYKGGIVKIMLLDADIFRCPHIILRVLRSLHFIIPQIITTNRSGVLGFADIIGGFKSDMRSMLLKILELLGF